jgi:hypothetical protein
MGVSGNVTTDRELDRFFGVREADGERGYPKPLRDGIPMTYLDKYLREKLTGFQYEERTPKGETIKIPV